MQNRGCLCAGISRWFDPNSTASDELDVVTDGSGYSPRNAALDGGSDTVRLFTIENIDAAASAISVAAKHPEKPGTTGAAYFRIARTDNSRELLATDSILVGNHARDSHFTCANLTARGSFNFIAAGYGDRPPVQELNG
jgi:hypothetical protein